MVTHLLKPLNDQATTSKQIVVKCPESEPSCSFYSQVKNLQVQIHHLNFDEDLLYEEGGATITYNQCLSATFTFSTTESFLGTSEVIHKAGTPDTIETSLDQLTD